MFSLFIAGIFGKRKKSSQLPVARWHERRLDAKKTARSRTHKYHAGEGVPGSCECSVKTNRQEQADRSTGRNESALTSRVVIRTLAGRVDNPPFLIVYRTREKADESVAGSAPTAVRSGSSSSLEPRSLQQCVVNAASVFRSMVKNIHVAHNRDLCPD